MNVSGVAILIVFLVALVYLQKFQMSSVWPIARPRIDATWPMRPGFAEGFQGAADAIEKNEFGYSMPPALKAWLPAPEVLTKPIGGEGGDCDILYSAGNFEAGVGKPYKSYDLLPNGKPEPRVAGGPTSQQCYQVDWARGLERAGSYAQRTNNYPRGYPDSCSAPYHELILNFYKTKPMEAPYQV
jgi:hypothetical protein